MDYLAAYDISDPKRLRRIAKLMESYGYRVQKSVFECNLSKKHLESLSREIRSLLDPNVDSVRFYPLPGNSRLRQTIIGRGEVSPASASVIIP